MKTTLTILRPGAEPVTETHVADQVRSPVSAEQHFTAQSREQPAEGCSGAPAGQR